MGTGFFVSFCIILATVRCEGPIKCVQGDGSDGSARDCTGEFAEATQCSQPKFVQYTGISPNVNYNCGPCPDELEGVTCESCEGSDTSACNEKKETGTDFQCHDYEYVDGSFKMKTETTVCKRLADTEVKCNMPGENAGEHYETKRGGCGECPYMERQAGQCAQCDREQCNKTPIKCVLGDGSDLTPRRCIPLANGDPPTVCHRPTDSSEAVNVYQVGNHCGPCSDSQSGICEESKPVPIKCMVGTEITKLPQACKSSDAEDIPIKCHQTKFIQYFGLVDEDNYGCGECPAGKEKTCQDCYGNPNQPCNKKVETNPDYKCYEYEYNTKSKKFETKEEMVTCYRLKNTAPKCNMPGKNATAATDYENRGCGGCTEAEMAAVTCTECGTIECNTGHTFSILMAFAVPLFVGFLQ
ncbi:hypothetical protein ACHWQZ_G006343 [Mnemiopsis leidyi]